MPGAVESLPIRLLRGERRDGGERRAGCRRGRRRTAGGGLACAAPAAHRQRRAARGRARGRTRAGRPGRGDRTLPPAGSDPHSGRPGHHRCRAARSGAPRTGGGGALAGSRHGRAADRADQRGRHGLRLPRRGAPRAASCSPCAARASGWRWSCRCARTVGSSSGELRYDPEAFDRADAQALVARYERVLAAVVDDLQAPIMALALSDAAERDQLLAQARSREAAPRHRRACPPALRARGRPLARAGRGRRRR